MLTEIMIILILIILLIEKQHIRFRNRDRSDAYIFFVNFENQSLPDKEPMVDPPINNCRN